MNAVEKSSFHFQTGCISYECNGQAQLQTCKYCSKDIFLLDNELPEKVSFSTAVSSVVILCAELSIEVPTFPE